LDYLDKVLTALAVLGQQATRQAAVVAPVG